MKRRGITLQAIKDTKKKTVEERIHLVRDQLIRYDQHQRRIARDHNGVCSVWGRTPPENHWAIDEFCITKGVKQWTRNTIDFKLDTKVTNAKPKIWRSDFSLSK